MTLKMSVVHNIEAILFDMNGTLRMREPHEPTQHAAIARMLELLEKEKVDWEELTRRQKAYVDWAQENLLQLSEAEIWSRWILPDYQPEKIGPIAAELTLAWSERKGHTIPCSGAGETLSELKRRGYRLGIISNTMSTLDIPRSLDAFGWRDYFDVVILSSTLKIRKPSPEPFLEAARHMKVPPERCAYVGNRIPKDMPGCKQAGFALGLIIKPSDRSSTDKQDQSIAPDVAVQSLSDLLDIFPVRY